MALRVADRLGRTRGRLSRLEGYRRIAPAPLKPDLSRWDNAPLAASWIGHATVLLRIDGVTIITDPVFATRVGIGLGLLTAGPRRLVAPALKLSELPPIDLILLSHAHFDHLDRPTLRHLPRSTPVIVANRTEDLVRDLGFRNLKALRWGEQHQVKSLRIKALPVVHWGARTFYDVHRGFNGYLIESPRHRIVYGGDTAYGEHFADLNHIDLAIMGIGAYDPWIAGHANPEQALAMANQMHAERILPMHHSTFKLSHEPMTEPMERMREATRDDARLIIQQVGGAWYL
jgi:L-ascorbate metabolism protein UlaG (beta-lactamase superfamily)